MKVNLLSKNNTNIAYKAKTLDLYRDFLPQNQHNRASELYAIEEALKILENIKFPQADIENLSSVAELDAIIYSDKVNKGLDGYFDKLENIITKL